MPQSSFAAPYLTFGQAISTCFDKYAVFRGRASRSEYWWWYLFTNLVSVGLTLVGVIGASASNSLGAMAGVNVLSGIWSLVILLPSMAVLFRRLHDTGRSGWWVGGLWLAIIPLGVVTAMAAASQTPSSGAAVLAVLGWLGWIGVGVTIFVFTLLPGHTDRNDYQAD